MSNLNQNREQYLNKAKDLIMPIFESKGFSIPKEFDKIVLSVGFPKGSRKAIGQHWMNYDNDGQFIDHQIFINPVIDDSIKAIDILIHELCHAIQTANKPDAKAHGSEFIELAKAIGLERGTIIKKGKEVKSYTATHANHSLKGQIKSWVQNELGEYPHEQLHERSIPKQGTRLLKAFCPQGDGGKGEYKVRITNGVADMGLPICPCCEGDYQDAIRSALKDETLKLDPDSIDLDYIAEPYRLILE